ncbi:MAG: cardiolipin synthase [Granulosicoccus sp.]|nr:cardiolipin synthase [Granulosicoccus sp.]
MISTLLEKLGPGTAYSLVGVLYLSMALIAGLHVVLHKRNEAAAFSWLGIIVLAPLFGAALYWLFGINRIRRRARAELSDHVRIATSTRSNGAVETHDLSDQWQQRLQFGMGVHNAPYVGGNSVVALVNGDNAYPEMLAAIERAKHYVVLSSYIFEFDEIGRQFVAALVSAHRRGVLVRVLIDGLGVGYGVSLVRSDRVLRSQGVKTARFLATLSTSGTRFINLRNHRKILAVDGVCGFVGGINIRDENLLTGSTDCKTRDVHFKISGPVINQINAVFAADWEFATKETLHLTSWKPTYSTDGNVIGRVLLDGPDDNYQKLQLTILGAVQSAQFSLSVVTPYFLPDKTIMSALQLAVLRGVKVDVCLPKKNNLALVGWAMAANLQQLLDIGVRVYQSPEPFDHSKLFVVDDDWCLIGSSNWDARSLELNFEINLECYEEGLNRSLRNIVAEKISCACELVEPPSHHFFIRIRNNFCRLLSPYL